MAYKPHFAITPRLLKLLTQATELRLWIAKSSVEVAWLPALQKETAARLAHSSTAIEGNPLSLEQAQLLAGGEVVAAQEKSKKEVLDYLQALKWVGRERRGAVLNEKKLFLLHKLITQGTLDKKSVGRYKIKPNRIIDAKGRTVYTPPAPKEVRKLTRELIAWINQCSDEEFHPLIVSAIAHHQLVSIHPFSDGNGRISRALAIWVLYTHNFDTHHLFAWDEFFEADRSKYYQKIQQARELDCDLTYWLEYAAEGLVQTLEKTKERILSLQIKKKRLRFTLTPKQEEVLRFIREHGKVKSPEISQAFNLTRARVNQLVKPLVDARVLVRKGETRSTTYRIAS